MISPEEFQKKKVERNQSKEKMQEYLSALESMEKTRTSSGYEKRYKEKGKNEIDNYWRAKLKKHKDEIAEFYEKNKGKISGRPPKL